MKYDLAGIAQLLTALVVLGTFIQNWRNSQKLTIVKEQTDGINEKLVKVTGEAEYARGLKHGERNPK